MDFTFLPPQDEQNTIILALFSCHSKNPRQNRQKSVLQEGTLSAPSVSYPQMVWGCVCACACVQHWHSTEWTDMWICQRIAYFKFIPFTHTHTHTLPPSLSHPLPPPPPTHTHTLSLIPFEDSEPTGLKVDIAEAKTWKVPREEARKVSLPIPAKGKWTAPEPQPIDPLTTTILCPVFGGLLQVAGWLHAANARVLAHLSSTPTSEIRSDTTAMLYWVLKTNPPYAPPPSHRPPLPKRTFRLCTTQTRRWIFSLPVAFMINCVLLDALF